jgi:hypothetical protein
MVISDGIPAVLRNRKLSEFCSDMQIEAKFLESSSESFCGIKNALNSVFLYFALPPPNEVKSI